jgi:hypothetical protein
MHAITNTTPEAGVTCLRYSQPGFALQDGGVGRACRGETVDDEPTGKTLAPDVVSFYDCQVHCTRTTYCYGISYNSSNNNCEVWTHPMESSIPSEGSTCLSFEPRPSSSLLCVSLAIPWTGEPQLLEYQLANRESIFACEDFAIYANPPFTLGEGLVPTRDMEMDLHCPKGGAFYTYLNTPIFMHFWDRIIQDAQFKSNTWTVKVDPDAVFFPRRLHDIVRPYQTQTQRQAAYLNNCQLGLHGPLEVLSRRALEVYFNQHYSCPRPGTEDTYLEGCLRQMGVQQLDRWDLLAEKECWRSGFVKDPQWYLCNTAHACFHPMKNVNDYRNCVYNARQSWSWRNYAAPH